MFALIMVPMAALTNGDTTWIKLVGAAALGFITISRIRYVNNW